MAVVFLFYSVHGSSISHGWRLVITRIWNNETRQSKCYTFWGWQCKEASFWKRGHTGCYSSWAWRHPMWVRPIHCLRKVIRPVAFGQTAWTSTMCKSEKRTLRYWLVLPLIWRWNGRHQPYRQLHLFIVINKRADSHQVASSDRVTWHWRGVWQVRERKGSLHGFRWGNPKKREHVEDGGSEGKMILKRVLNN